MHELERIDSSGAGNFNNVGCSIGLLGMGIVSANFLRGLPRLRTGKNDQGVWVLAQLILLRSLFEPELVNGINHNVMSIDVHFDCSGRASCGT
jgi:hypothetical protein